MVPVFRRSFSAFLFLCALSVALANVFIQSPVVTGNEFRVSGYRVTIPDDIKDTIADAKAQKKPLHIFAAAVEFTEDLDLISVPSLQILAESCSTQGLVNIDASVVPKTSGNETSTGGAESPPSQNSRSEPFPPLPTPQPPPPPSVTVAPGGNVTILCARVDGGATLSIVSDGEKGVPGQKGLPGRKGLTGTPTRRGSCNVRGRFGSRKCLLQGVNRGTFSTNGENGGRGGQGGQGGATGRVALFISRDADVSVLSKGGVGGPGGPGGDGGEKGGSVSVGSVITRCTCPGSKFGIGCLRCQTERSEAVSRPRIFDGVQGDTGPNGFPGRVVPPIVKNDLSGTESHISARDFSRFIKLLERFYNDVILASEISSEEMIELLDRMIFLIGLRQDTAFLRNAALRANIFRQRLVTGAGLFGSASLSRVASNKLSQEVDDAIERARDINDEIQRVQATEVLAEIITTAAQIQVSKVNFGEIERTLSLQRNNHQEAVEAIDEQIKDTIEDIDKALSDADADQSQRNSQLLSLLSSAIGFGGAIAGKDPFAAFQSVIEIGQIAAGFADDAAKRCSSNDLRALIQVAPELRGEFPNAVDFSDDFSQILGIGAVGDLQKSELASKAARLTADLACVFDADLPSLPNVVAAFEQFFIKGQSRIDILTRIIDIDIELNNVRIQREAVEQQKAGIEALSGNVDGLQPADVYDTITDIYETARIETLENIARLVASYGNLVLRELTEDLKDYGKGRLAANGFVVSDFLDLTELEARVRSTFRDADTCFFEDQLPTIRFYFFDLTRETSPELFSSPLKTGSQNGQAFTLDISRDCASFDSSSPAKRNETGQALRQCSPNLVDFNARLLSVAVELLGGDETLIPNGAGAVRASLEQIGKQTFLRAPNAVQSFDVAPLLFSLSDIPLETSNGDVDFAPICSEASALLGGSSVAENLVTSPLACPSPFATYVFKVGRAVDEEVDQFLKTVTKIRVHAKISTRSRGCN